MGEIRLPTVSLYTNIQGVFSLKKRRNVFITFLATALLLFSIAGNSSAAARRLEDYFYVSVSMQGSAGMVRARPLAVSSDAGTEIEDWGQAVFAGSDIAASLSRRNSHSYTAPTGLQVQWKFYDKKNTLTKTDYGWDTTAPDICAGGHLVVTVSLKSAAGDWEAGSVSSYVAIN